MRVVPARQKKTKIESKTHPQPFPVMEGSKLR
jgi:hypothetical protein